MKPSISSDYAVLETAGGLFYYGYEYLYQVAPDRSLARDEDAPTVFGGYVESPVGHLVFSWEHGEDPFPDMAEGLLVTMGKFFEACSGKSNGEGLALPL